MITTIDNKGVELITKWEGLRLKPYLCSGGVPTIGYGSTKYENRTRVKLTDPPIDKGRAFKIFTFTIAEYERAVFTLTPDTINQNQFNALVSFAYNLGINALKNSTLLKKVNKDINDPSIATEFNKWINCNGKPLQGLINRRKEESEMYFK